MIVEISVDDASVVEFVRGTANGLGPPRAVLRIRCAPDVVCMAEPAARIRTDAGRSPLAVWVGPRGGLVGQRSSVWEPSP